jgi:molecular chaperone DnaJ
MPLPQISRKFTSRCVLTTHSSHHLSHVYKLARKYHPDTNPDKNAREKFVEIQQAYDVGPLPTPPSSTRINLRAQILKDEKKRASYDQYGAASQQPGFDPDAFANARNNPFTAGGFGGFQDFSAAFGSGGGGSGDLFEHLFGAALGRGRGRGTGFSESSRGDDIEFTIGLPFLEACKGTTRSVNLTPVTNCTTCSGSGLKAGAKRATCGACGGSGTRTFVIDSGFQMASTCSTCGGTGSTVPRNSQCASCAGVGKVRTKKTVQVSVPPGE